MQYAKLAEISTLRAAATAAVAECTGGLGIVGASALSQQPRPNASSSPHPVNSEGDTQPQESLGSVTRTTQGLSIQGDNGAAPAHDLSGHHQPAGHGHALDSLQACPPHGAKAICGRRPKMEDAYTAIPFLLEVPVPADQLCVSELIPPRIATHVRTASNAPEHEASETHPETATAPQASAPSMHHNQYMETLHFFGVFDGHGGAEAALHCAQTLHQRIAEALSAVSSPAAQDKIRESFARSQREAAAHLSTSSSLPVQQVHPHHSTSFQDARLQPLANPTAGDNESDSDEDSAVNEVLQEERRASQDRDEQPTGREGAQAAPATANEHAEAQAPAEVQTNGEEDSDAPCSASKFQSALTNAFTKADEEFGKADNAALVGTTAVVALVGSRQLYVANCGELDMLSCSTILA